MIKNQDGFTVVEVMIAGVVVAVLSLALAAYMFQQTQKQKNVDLQHQTSQIAESGILTAGQVQAVSVTQDFEFESLSNPTPTPIPDPTLPTPVPYWSSNQVKGYGENNFTAWGSTSLNESTGLNGLTTIIDPSTTLISMGAAGLLEQLSQTYNQPAIPPNLSQLNLASAGVADVNPTLNSIVTGAATPTCSDPPGMTTGIPSTTTCTGIVNINCNIAAGMKLLWKDAPDCQWNCVPDCDLNYVQ